MEPEYSKLVNEYQKKFHWTDEEMAAIWQVLSAAFKWQKEEIISKVEEV